MRVLVPLQLWVSADHIDQVRKDEQRAQSAVREDKSLVQRFREKEQAGASILKNNSKALKKSKERLKKLQAKQNHFQKEYAEHKRLVESAKQKYDIIGECVEDGIAAYLAYQIATTMSAIAAGSQEVQEEEASIEVIKEKLDGIQKEIREVQSDKDAEEADEAEDHDSVEKAEKAEAADAAEGTEGGAEDATEGAAEDAGAVEDLPPIPPELVSQLGTSCSALGVMFCSSLLGTSCQLQFLIFGVASLMLLLVLGCRVIRCRRPKNVALNEPLLQA